MLKHYLQLCPVASEDRLMSGCQDLQREPRRLSVTTTPGEVAVGDDSTWLKYNRVHREEIGRGVSHRPEAALPDLREQRMPLA